MVIRPIRSKDFRQVLKLYGQLFTNEARVTSIDVKRFERVARLYRLVELLLPVVGLFDKEFETILVARSGDRVIGEIHVVPHGKNVWSLDSSAVDSAFRRRGVYGKLLPESLKYVSERGGEQVNTNLWTNNVAPVKVTNRLGFEVIETQVLLGFEQHKIPTVDSSRDILIRDIKKTDLDKIYQICRALSPKRMQASRMTPADFGDSFLGSLMSRMTWSCSKKWVMEFKGRIVGYAQVTFTPPEQNGQIESFCVLSPDATSKLTSLLLHEILQFLAKQNVKRLHVYINEKWKETIDVFKSFGFKPIASVYEMTKELP